jgi:hypothetical protein
VRGTKAGASALKAGAAASSSPVPPHPNSIHYRTFTSDCQGLTDFHTRVRDHSKLAPGVLDEDGILAHTDFDIDPSRCDADNEEHFQEFFERRRNFEVALKALYEKTPSKNP